MGIKALTLVAEGNDEYPVLDDSFLVVIELDQDFEPLVDFMEPLGFELFDFDDSKWSTWRHWGANINLSVIGSQIHMCLPKTYDRLDGTAEPFIDELWYLEPAKIVRQMLCGA